MTFEEYNILANKVIEARLGFTPFGCNAKCPLWYHCETRDRTAEMPCELTDDEVELIKVGKWEQLAKPLELPRTNQVQMPVELIGMPSKSHPKQEPPAKPVVVKTSDSVQLALDLAA